MVAYPAGPPPNPKKKFKRVDAIYPSGSEKVAKAHAWMFPSKVIQVRGKKGRSRIFREAIESPHAGRPEEDTPPAMTLPTHDLPDAVKHVTNSINSTGARALLVGGSVRDRLMGKPSKDFDVEVYGMHPDHLATHLGQIGKVDAVGKSFGVLKLSHGGEDFDVSIPRRDQKTGKGTKGFMATPDPTMTIGEAGKRRDFTMNSVAMDPVTGHVYDPHGGIADIKNRTLRATDHTAFAEDPLRILRGAQFAARHQMTVHPDTMKLMQSASHELKDLPKERVHAEWKKLLTKGAHPSLGIDILHKSGALAALHPELHGLHDSGALDHTKQAMDRAVAQTKSLKPSSRDAVHHATLLHHLDPETAANVASLQLGATKDTAAKVKNLVGEHKAALALHHGDRASEGDVRRLAARLHPASAEELAHVMHASHPSGSSPAGNWLTQKAKEHEVHEGPTKPLLTGKHMMELGMKPGKEVGAIIKRVLELQMDGHVKTVEDAKEAARGMIPKTISASLDGTPSLFERIVGRSLWEAIDFAGDLDRAMKKHGPAHPNTTKALKAAAANMERLPVEAQKRVRLALAVTVGHEVRSDLGRGTRWQQTAGVDFDLKRALIEGLARYFEDANLAGKTAAMVGGHGQKPTWWPGRNKWNDQKGEFAKSMAHAADLARRVTRRHGIHTGERLGAGVSGVVHASTGDSVIKYDKGDNEARLAHAVMKHPVLGRLTSLPRIHNVIDTGVDDQKTGERIHAIHRENVGNLTSKRPEAWAEFGNDVHHLSMGLRDGSVTSKHIRPGLETLAQKHRESIHPSERGHFDQVVGDLHKMGKHGILPCDLHADNWGSRKNGQVVMRDGGCYSLAAAPKQSQGSGSDWAKARS